MNHSLFNLVHPLNFSAVHPLNFSAAYPPLVTGTLYFKLLSISINFQICREHAKCQKAIIKYIQVLHIKVFMMICAKV